MEDKVVRTGSTTDEGEGESHAGWNSLGNATSEHGLGSHHRHEKHSHRRKHRRKKKDSILKKIQHWFDKKIRASKHFGDKSCSDCCYDSFVGNADRRQCTDRPK